MKPSVWIAVETKVDGTRRVEWTLKNKFLQVTGKGGDFESREMNRFDQQRRVYSKWTFDTNASVGEWRGRWSEKKQTMTWKLDAAGFVEGKMVERFISDDTYETTLVIRDNDDNLLLETKTVYTRVKETVDLEKDAAEHEPVPAKKDAKKKKTVPFKK